jgi:hypothetical protein
MTCPCPECSAFGHDTHTAPLPPDQPDDWFHEYEPESIPFAAHWGGCLISLIAAPLLLFAVARNALIARFWK